MAQQRERFAIVGGGILGLTLAHRIARSGKHVSLFEAADNLGGLASAWQVGDVVWDRHYHVTLGSDTALRAVLADLGLERDVRWAHTRTGFYANGNLYSMSDVHEFLRFPLLGAIDKARLAMTILRASRARDGKLLEEISVSDWLIRQCGKRTFETLWLPLLRAKLGDNYKKTSAAFIWAVISRMYSARRSGHKRELFGYVRGGYARILDRFEEVLRAAGVDIYTSHAVESIRRNTQGRQSITFRSGKTESFEKVIVTTPAPIAATMCPELAEDEIVRLKGIHYQGIVCASLLLRRPLAGYYITNIVDSWVPFTAVIEMSALVDRQLLGGHTLVYLPKYLPSDDPGFALPDEQIETGFVHALERMYPGFSADDVLACRISRARYVLPLTTIGYSKRLPPVQTSMPGLALLNSAHIVNGTLNVNETIELVNRHLDSLLRPHPQVLQKQPARTAR